MLALATSSNSVKAKTEIPYGYHEGDKCHKIKHKIDPCFKGTTGVVYVIFPNFKYNYVLSTFPFQIIFNYTCLKE